MKHQLSFSLFFSLIALLTLNACSYPMSLAGAGSQSSTVNNQTSAITTTDPALQDKALAILYNNCASCHGSSSGPAGVYGLNNLTHLINSGLIVAGSPDQSLLFNSINSKSMPPNQPLSQQDIDLVSQWIASLGATSNTGSGTGSTGGTTTTPTPAPSPTPTVPAAATFTYVQSILKTSCVGCHSTSYAKAGYAFDTYKNVMKSVNVSSPKESLLYTITQSGEMPPRPRASLNSDQLRMILSWIESGAPNN